MAVKGDGEIGLGVAVHVGLDDGLVRGREIAKLAGVVAPWVGVNEGEVVIDALSRRNGVDGGEIDEVAGSRQECRLDRNW